MMAISLYCESCTTRFLIVMDDAYIEDEGEGINTDYVCPVCDSTVWTNEDNSSIVFIEVQQ